MVDLYRMIDLMQEAALVVTSFRQDFWTRHVNDGAARAIGGDAADLVDCGLLEVLPADTAQILHQLCNEALRAEGPVEYFAAAPDPLTDLSGTASVAVRATRIDDTVLCTWVPGWETADGDDRAAPLRAATSVRDRLQLAATLDALAGTGFGVFSFDLMTGRLIWSIGMYKIFGRSLQEGPLGPAELRPLLEPEAEPTACWQALVETGEPLDVEVRLMAQLGGKRLRFNAYATHGPDGLPTIIHGRCCVLRS